MTKNQALLYVHTFVNDEELVKIDNFIAEHGFNSRAEFIRACISDYMGEDIFRPRFHNPKLKIDQWEKRDLTRRKVREFFDSLPEEEFESFGGWKFASGRVVLNTDRQKIQVFFDDTPDTETLQIIRINHFTWKPQVKAWETRLKMSVVKKLRALDLFKPIPE